MNEYNNKKSNCSFEKDKVFNTLFDIKLLDNILNKNK